MRLHGLARHLVADETEQALGELRAARTLDPAARQAAERAAVHLVEHDGLPGREDAGPDRAHVGVRQQIEHAQPLRIADRLGEIGDRLGVVDVPPLGHVRHGQMMRDEELHDGGVLGGQGEAGRQLFRERNALGHVAVPLGLADVVQQHPQHQELGLVHLAPHLRDAFRLRRFPRRHRLEMLDGEERVLIGREPVIDVVLHEARQGAELGQIAAEQAQLVHLGEREGHPTPVPADVEKEIAHERRAPEVVVDGIERVFDGALQVQGQLAAEPVQVPEDLHQPQRLLAEDPGVAVRRVQATVDEDQAIGQRLLALASLRGAAAGQRLLAAGDEPAGDPVDGARVQVVLAHEALDPEAGRVARVAEVLGDPRLDLPPQDVVLVRRQEVQLVPHAPEERQRRVGLGLLAGGDEPPVRQLAERARLELGGAEPHGRVHVAQAARRLLDVGLAHVGRGAELPVPLVALGQRRHQELPEVAPVDVLAEHPAEPREEPAVAGDEPRLLHRGPARQIGTRHGHAIVQGAEAVADLQPQVPQRVQELLRHALHVRRELAIVNDHEVDVGGRMELTPAVAPEGNDHERRGRQRLVREVRGDQAHEGADEIVDEPRMRAHGLLTRRAVVVPGPEGLESLGEGGAEEIDPQAAPVRATLGLRLRASGPAIQLGRHVEAERSNAGRRLSNAAQSYYNAERALTLASPSRSDRAVRSG